MSYANSQYLVETGWLAAHLEDPDIRIFDVTGMLTSSMVNVARKRSYVKGHIPGAAYLDVASPSGPLSASDSWIPWTWPPLEQFQTLMGEIGVSNESQVVLYAASPRQGIDYGPMWCTRAWWLMHHYGVHCAILNGGWEKWVAEGRMVSTDDATYPPARFAADPGWQRGIAMREDVLQAIEEGGVACVVDSLSAESYAGTDKIAYGPRKGHISSAVNVPASAVIDEGTGLYASAETIREYFANAGVLDAGKVITYCGGGIAATVNAFALALIGYTDVAVYDGSLMEWTLDPSLPMTDPSGGQSSG